MSIFNKLLDQDKNQSLPGDLQQINENPQTHDFFFCLNIRRYFEVEEQQIMERMKSSIIMKPAFREVVQHKPDIYGPFWIATTLIVIIVASSSLINFFYNYGVESKDQQKQYDFDQIPVAGALIYGICFGAPYVIAVMIKIFGGTVSVVQLICIYGYSLTVFLPVTVFLFLNSVIIQTILLVVAYSISTVFLIRGILSMDRKMGDRQKMALGVFIMGVQLILVLMYKFYFFDLI